MDRHRISCIGDGSWSSISSAWMRTKTPSRWRSPRLWPLNASACRIPAWFAKCGSGCSRVQLWRNVCNVTRLVRPAALTAERQAACNTVGSIGLSSSRPGNRKVLGRASLQWARRMPSNCGDSITLRSCRPCHDGPGSRLARCRCRTPSVPRHPTPEPRRIGRRQRRLAVPARYGLEKPHDLVGAEHDRKLTRLTCIRDALGNLSFAECDAVEEAQSANNLVETRP
jgi:hypothetical protein